MKAFILITLFFLFYFITVKDIYDEKMFLTEDVKILENEVGQKDSIILKLQYQNEKLKQKISKMTIIKKPKNRSFYRVNLASGNYIPASKRDYKTYTKN